MVSGNFVIIGPGNALAPTRLEIATWTSTNKYTPINKLQRNVIHNTIFLIQEIAFERLACIMSAILLRPQFLKTVPKLFWYIFRS